MKVDLSSFNSTKLNKIPKNSKELRSLVGYINYSRNCIPNISGLLAPINNKLKYSKLIWTKNDELTVQQIEKEILKNHKLSVVKQGETFTLACDASEEVIAGVLTQNDWLIKLWSKKLLPGENLKIIVEKEQMVIENSLKAFRTLIGNNKLIINSDNKNITRLNNNNNRTQRFKSLLLEFNAEIQHISGISNNCADFLSRACSLTKVNEESSYRSLNRYLKKQRRRDR